MEHSQAGVKDDVWLGLVGKRKVRWLVRNGKRGRGSWRENVFIFSLKCTTKTFGGRSPPGPAGELKRSPSHPSHSGCHGREHSLAQLGALYGEEEGGNKWKGRR